MDDLLERYGQQADRQLRLGGLKGLYSFFGASATRLNAWSAMSDVTSPITLENTAETKAWSLQKVTDELAARIRAAAKKLVPEEPTPVLSLPEDRIDFGAWAVGTTWTRYITITNAGTRDLVIDGIGLTGPDFRFPLEVRTPWTIRPGLSESLLVEFVPSVLGLRNGTLTIESNDPNVPSANIWLEGRGAHRFDVEPARLDFGTVHLTRGASATLKILNRGQSGDVGVTKWTTSGPAFSAPFDVPFTLKPKRSKSVAVHFTPPTVGAFEGTVRIECTGCPERPPIEIPLSAEACPEQIRRVVKGGRWFKRKYSLTKDLVRYSFEPCQDSRDWMHLGHYTM